MYRTQVTVDITKKQNKKKNKKKQTNKEDGFIHQTAYWCCNKLHGGKNVYTHSNGSKTEPTWGPLLIGGEGHHVKLKKKHCLFKPFDLPPPHPNDRGFYYPIRPSSPQTPTLNKHREDLERLYRFLFDTLFFVLF